MKTVTKLENYANKIQHSDMHRTAKVHVTESVTSVFVVTVQKNISKNPCFLEKN